jgi:hypothetical protein
MRVIDSDGHFHEPHYLFEEYMEKEYWGKRVVKIQVIRGKKGVVPWREKSCRESPRPEASS